MAGPSFAERHFSRISTNDSAIRIDNPFKNRLLEDIDAEAKAFAGLISEGPPTELLRLFKIAGRICFNPRGWKEGIASELSQHEIEVLNNERKRRIFQQPKLAKLTIFVLWLSSINHGWIQSTLNGANLGWPTDLNPRGPNGSPLSAWHVAALNATVFFVASAACWLSDPFQSRFMGTRGLGRRAMLFIAAVLTLAVSIGAAYVQSLTGLLACRVLLGVSMGLKASVTSIYAAEISTCHLRGAIVMSWQAGDALGICLGFTANLIAIEAVGSTRCWRWQTASPAIPALLLMALIWIVPDSPRLYLKKGEYQHAFEAMCQLRETPLQAARDLFYANAQLQVESEKLLQHVELGSEEFTKDQSGIQMYQMKVAKLRWWHRLNALVTNGRTRRALLASLIVMIAQQLCGFNVLAFYSNSWLAGLTDQQREMVPSYLSWGIGACNFLFTLPAFYLIDSETFGRAGLLLATYPGMILFMFATTLTFACAGNAVPRASVEVLVFLFTICYSLGQGPVAFTYAAEVFPLTYRESGMSVVVAANLLGAGLLALFVPQAAQFPNDSSPNDRVYNRAQAIMLAIFVVLGILALTLIFCFVPETAHCTSAPEDLNHLSLEELGYIFEQPMLHHMNYRIRGAFRFGSSGYSPDLYSMGDGSDEPSPSSGEQDSQPHSASTSHIERRSSEGGPRAGPDTGAETRPETGPAPRPRPGAGSGPGLGPGLGLGLGPETPSPASRNRVPQIRRRPVPPQQNHTNNHSPSPSNPHDPPSSSNREIDTQSHPDTNTPNPNQQNNPTTLTQEDNPTTPRLPRINAPETSPSIELQRYGSTPFRIPEFEPSRRDDSPSRLV